MPRSLPLSLFLKLQIAKLRPRYFFRFYYLFSTLTTMKLFDYPTAIAQQQRQLLQTEQHIRRLQDILNHLTAAIDTSIAFAPDFKNEAQRKARRVEMMASAEYRKALGNLLIAQDKRTEIEIDLNLLRNQLSVLKLEMRETITTRELQLVDAA